MRLRTFPEKKGSGETRERRKNKRTKLKRRDFELTCGCVLGPNSSEGRPHEEGESSQDPGDEYHGLNAEMVVVRNKANSEKVSLPSFLFLGVISLPRPRRVNGPLR